MEEFILVYSSLSLLWNYFLPFQEYLDLQPPLVSPLLARTPSSSEEDNVFGSSEHVCDLTKSSNSLNFDVGEGYQDGVDDTEHDIGDGYADIRHDPDIEPLLDFSGSKTSLSSKSSFFGKRPLNQLNGSIVSLSSQLSKQIQAIEDCDSDNGEEHIGLLENDTSQGSDDAFETGDISIAKTGLTNSPSSSKGVRPSQSSGVMETSLDSGEVDPMVLMEYTLPQKANPPRRPSQQTEV